MELKIKEKVPIMMNKNKLIMASTFKHLINSD